MKNIYKDPLTTIDLETQPMKNSFDDSASTIDLDLDDDILFSNYVVMEDNDLRTIDSMLRNIFAEAVGS